MKALSVKQPWANMIASGEKTIETRMWATTYRGLLLIVSSKIPDIEPAGMALALVELYDCKPMTEADQLGACCPVYEGAFSWKFKNIKKIENPYPVRGHLGLYEVDFSVVAGIMVSDPRTGGGMDFSEALIFLKAGNRVTRAGWGQGVYIYLADNIIGFNVPDDIDSGFSFRPFIVVKKSDNTLVPWVAGQDSFLADDWEVVA